MLPLLCSLCGPSSTTVETPPKNCNYARRGAVIGLSKCVISSFPTILSNQCILSFSSKFVPYPFKVYKGPDHIASFYFI